MRPAPRPHPPVALRPYLLSPQLHQPPHRYVNMSRTFPPQGLCTSVAGFFKYALLPVIHMATSHAVFFQTLLLVQ